MDRRLVQLERRMHKRTDDGRSDGLTDERTKGNTNGRTADGRTDGRMNKQTVNSDDGRTDGRMDGRAVGRTNGRIDTTERRCPVSGTMRTIPPICACCTQPTDQRPSPTTTVARRSGMKISCPRSRYPPDSAKSNLPRDRPDRPRSSAPRLDSGSAGQRGGRTDGLAVVV